MSMTDREIRERIGAWEGDDVGDEWLQMLSDDELSRAWWIYSAVLYGRFGRFYRALETEMDARGLRVPQ